MKMHISTLEPQRSNPETMVTLLHTFTSSPTSIDNQLQQFFLFSSKKIKIILLFREDQHMTQVFRNMDYLINLPYKFILVSTFSENLRAVNQKDENESILH